MLQLNLSHSTFQLGKPLPGDGVVLKTVNSLGVSSLLNVLCCKMSSLTRHNNGWIAMTVLIHCDGVASSITGKGGKFFVLQGHPCSVVAGHFCVLPAYNADPAVK